MSPLGIAFVSAIHAVLYKDILSKLNDGFDVSFFVELGNKNNGNIERYFKWLKEQPVFGERLGVLALVSKSDCRAIQLADFLAFHGRREADQWAKNGYTEQFSKGPAMQIMVSHIYHRHNRLYDDGSGISLADPFFVPDGANGLILPSNGIP